MENNEINTQFVISKDEDGKIVGKQIIIMKGKNFCEFCNKVLKDGDWGTFCDQSKKTRCDSSYYCKYHDCNGLPRNHEDIYTDIKIKKVEK